MIANRPGRPRRFFLALSLAYALCSWPGLADGAGARIDKIARTLRPRGISISVRRLADGAEIYARDAGRLRRIASVSKIFTVASALEQLGAEHRFNTLFYGEGVVGPSVGTLYIVGRGDPMLVSEEWQLIVNALPIMEIRDRIVVDDRFFSPDLDLVREPGVSNAYNARNAAFATNFNTLEVSLLGHDVRGEPQTPLTPFTVFELRPTRRGVLRVDTRLIDAHLRVRIRGPFAHHRRRLRFHLGQDPRSPALYAGYLFAATFTKQGKRVVKLDVQRGETPPGATFLYEHKNSRTLAQVSASLFEYSNNFVANQIFLTTGALVDGAPASVERSRALLRRQIAKDMGDEKVELFEGSGLDPRNRASASAVSLFLAKVQARQGDFFALMSERLDGRVRAKTGTYRDNGVRAMAGYILDDQRQPYLSFALLCDGRRCSARCLDRYDLFLQKLLKVEGP